MPPAPGELDALSDFIRMPYCVPVNEHAPTTKFETPLDVLPPMESPWPDPKMQFVIMMPEHVPPVLPSAMLSSPSLMLQFCTRQLVPIKSIPSVFGELLGVLIVIPWMVTLPVAFLKVRCIEGEFCSSTF